MTTGDAGNPFAGAAHFTRAEWEGVSSHPAKLPPAELIWRLEALRYRIGRPLPLLSGYRSEADNRAVGGRRRSRHRVGDAIDIPSGLVTIDQALGAGFRGIGHRGKWVVHLDCRPAASPVIFEDVPLPH